MSKKRAGAPTPGDLPPEEKSGTDSKELERLKKEFKESKRQLKRVIAESGAKNVEGKNVEMKDLREIIGEDDEKTIEKIKDLISEDSGKKNSSKTSSDINKATKRTLSKWKKYKKKKKEVKSANKN